MQKAARFLIFLVFFIAMTTNIAWAFIYTLEETGCGGGSYPDNALFQIIGSELRTNAVIQQENYPAGCTICIRTNDGSGASYDKAFTITITNVPPSVSSIVRANADPTRGTAVDFTVTFRENVTGVDTADFSLTTGGGIAGASVSSVSGSGTTYTVTVDTGTGSGTIRLDLIDNDTISDGTDDLGPGDASFTAGASYTVDKNVPGLMSFTRQTPGTSPTNADTLIFRATFDENVQNVDNPDFTVTGTTATIIDVTPQSPQVFDITVSGGDLASINNTVQLNLAAGQNITDALGNNLGAGEPATDEFYTMDNDSPGITSFARQTPATSPTKEDTLVFRATFDEAVQNVDAADFTVTGTTATITNINVINASTYDLTITGGDLAGLDGNVGINLAGGQNVADMLGNVLPGGEPATDQIYAVENTAPTVSINQAGGQTDPGTGSPINFTVTFNETVTGFDDGADITLSGTANPTNAAITGSGPYNVAVSGMDSVGTVIANIGVNVAQDAAGNGNAAATFTDNQVTYSPAAPSVSSINRVDGSPTKAASVNFIVTFNQSVSGIDTTDFSLVTSGTSGNIASVSSGSGTSVTVTVDSITGDGTLGLKLMDDDSIVNILSSPLGGVGVDNGNFTGQVYTIDRVAPRVTNVTATTADGTYYIGDIIDITVQFNEAVTVIGTPTLTLETGAADAVVDYNYGSSSDTLTFTYTVLQTHTAVDLDYLNTTALANGGGTIQDSVGNDATLTLAPPGNPQALGANKALVINGISRLVINEIDYNQGATDTAEFIEIKNVSGTSMSMSGYAILLIDSTAGPGLYQTINLDAVNLAAGDYYVICNSIGSSVANCDQATDLGNDFIQDGAPDAVQLVKGIAALDTVSFDGDTVGYTETFGAPSDSDTSDTFGLSRIPDGADTNINGMDFVLRCITPGETNGAVAPPGTCNTPPQVDLNGGNAGNDNTAAFTENGDPIPIAPAGTLMDANGGDIQSLTITLTNDLDGALEKLALNASALTAVTNDPDLSVTAYNSGTGILVISGAGTPAAYQTILQGIEYNNSDNDPDTTSRKITVIAGDGIANSTSRTSTVSITGVRKATVTTLTVSNVSINSARGNGNVTDLGSPSPIQHGVCWSTLTSPSTANDKTEEGTTGTTGVFTSNMTGLSSNTLYYCRAYVTNAAGTSYGAEVTFTTGQTVTSPPNPDPDPESNTEVVDGVVIKVETSTGSSGTQTETLTIPIVTADREEDTTTANDNLAEIPIAYRDKDQTEPALTLGFPLGVGAIASGPQDPQPSAEAVADLLQLIDETVEQSDPNKANMLQNGSVFLSALANHTELTVRLVTLTSDNTASVAPSILVKGTRALDSGSAASIQATVIDATALPPGSSIELENVEFAVIIGNDITITGGEGKNIVHTGAGSQYIILGPDDDELYGGAGDDTVKSLGGNDWLFGNSGDDILASDEGDNILHGGEDFDTALFYGNRDDYDIVQEHSMVTVQSKSDPEHVNTLINIEQIEFADQVLNITYDPELEMLAGLYIRVLGRQPDLWGIQHFAQLYAEYADIGQIAWAFLISPEAKSRGVQIEPNDPIQQIEYFYQTILGKEADEEGLAYWQAHYSQQNMSLSEIVYSFFTSEEAMIRGIELDSSEQGGLDVIEMFYRTLLSRTSDEAGKTFWTGALSQSYTLREIMESFYNSEEFALSGIDSMSHGEEKIIKGYYKWLLQRTYDDAGLAHWVNCHQQGASFTEIADFFMTSEEMIQGYIDPERWDFDID